MEKARRSGYQRIRRTLRFRTSSENSIIQYALNHLQPSTFAKFTIIPLLVFTTAVSFALLYGAGRPVIINSSLYDFIQSNRSSVQGILSILTSILGFVHLYTLRSTVNFSARILLIQHTPTLNRVKWWKVMSTNSIDLSLPMKFLIPAFVFCVLGVLPGFLWTTALTLSLTTRNITLTLQVPYYGSDPDPGCPIQSPPCTVNH